MVGGWGWPDIYEEMYKKKSHRWALLIDSLTHLIYASYEYLLFIKKSSWLFETLIMYRIDINDCWLYMVVATKEIDNMLIDCNE
jgi:hypothetical protein